MVAFWLTCLGKCHLVSISCQFIFLSCSPLHIGCEKIGWDEAKRTEMSVIRWKHFFPSSLWLVFVNCLSRMLRSGFDALVQGHKPSSPSLSNSSMHGRPFSTLVCFGAWCLCQCGFLSLKHLFPSLACSAWRSYTSPSRWNRSILPEPSPTSRCGESSLPLFIYLLICLFK